MPETNNKQYTQHDLDVAKQIAVLETKLDGLTINIDNRFDGIDKDIKSIIKHQNKSYSVKEVYSFVKKNYVVVGIIISLIIGGDAIRQKIFNMLINDITSQTSAQEENKK